MLESVLIDCPHCGEAFESTVDSSAGRQEYIEDCYVCCRPIICILEVDATGEFIGLTARHPDE